MIQSASCYKQYHYLLRFSTWHTPLCAILEKGENMKDLQSYMAEVIEELKRNEKFPAVHIYLCTCNSFTKFCGSASMPLHEVFTPGRLKEYENWMMQQELSLNTISTYMRTLRAVYNRWMPPGSTGHNPGLFNGVYTKVTAQTKRALTGRQMRQLIDADLEQLTKEQQSVLAYFVLMFLFRGMPFIDLAYLRKRDIDMRNGRITYRRHKTGRQLVVQIPREALPLLKTCKDNRPSSIYLFPILNAEPHDDWKLYQCYQDALRSFNKSLRRLALRLLPGVKISSYTARHTWATLSFHLGTPVGIISQALGHSSIRVTETYLKPFEEKRIDKENRKLISAVTKCKLIN